MVIVLKKPYTPPSAEELAKRSQIAQEKQQAEANRIAQAHAKAEKTAYGIWQNASPADPKHAYAQSKGLDVDILKGIRQNEYQGKKAANHSFVCRQKVGQRANY